MNQESASYREFWYNECTLALTMSAREERSVKTYFESGDVDAYLADELFIDPAIATFMAPQHQLDHFKNRVERCWNWLMENEQHPANKRARRRLTYDEQFSAALFALFIKSGNFFPDDFFSEVFSFMYGDYYDATRVFPVSLKFDGKPLVNTIRADELCTQLMTGIRKYLFETDEHDYFSYSRYKTLLPFFLSILPKMSVECFDTKKYGRFHKVNGKRSGLGSSQARVRRFFASLLGVSYDQDSNTQIQINDFEFHEHLKSELATVNMPESYSVLLEFIEEYGAESLNMSI